MLSAMLRKSSTGDQEGQSCIGRQALCSFSEISALMPIMHFSLEFRVPMWVGYTQGKHLALCTLQPRNLGIFECLMWRGNADYSWG